MIHHPASRVGRIHVVVAVQNLLKASYGVRRLLGQSPFLMGTAAALPLSVVWTFAYCSEHFGVPLTTLFRIGGDRKTLNDSQIQYVAIKKKYTYPK
jgi:hypothetical protein